MAGAPESPDSDVLLYETYSGRSGPPEELFAQVYNELRQVARAYMRRERADHTLQATALVNEVYLRLAHSEPALYQDRVHFFAVSARVMRRILVDWARGRQARKRGSDVTVLELEEHLAIPAGSGGLPELDPVGGDLEERPAAFEREVPGHEVGAGCPALDDQRSLGQEHETV